MGKHTTTTALTLLAGLGIAALTGCSSVGSPAENSADGDSSARFVACLTSHGVDAKIGDDSDLVFVASTGQGTGTGTGPAGSTDTGGSQPLMFEPGSDGTFWVAAQDSSYFAQDPQTQDAYSACEAEHPDFRQPEVSSADQPGFQAATGDDQGALGFAQCARDAGFGWIADPTADDGGAIRLPADLDEQEFRSLLTACWDQDAPLIFFRFDGELGFDYQAVLNEFTGAGVQTEDPTPVTGGDQ